MTPRGRLFLANPGPTNIPASVLAAVARPAVDYMTPDFLAEMDAAQAGLRRLLGTRHPVVMTSSSGHGGWEAALVNLFSPGDVVLMPETGFFSEAWAAMATALGLAVRTIPADIATGVTQAAIVDALRADATIRAVCLVHNETSTGVVLPVADIRRAIAGLGHPALVIVDGISSVGSLDLRMDEWDLDCVVGGGQKGLMLPAGLAFTAVGPRAWEAHRTAKLARRYWDWSAVQDRIGSFVGTVPVNLIYGLTESLHRLEEEGMPAVFARHHRLAGAVRAAVHAWNGNGTGPAVFCADPDRRSDSVTAVLVPEGHDAEAVRRQALQLQVSLGGGLGRLSGKVFPHRSHGRSQRADDPRHACRHGGRHDPRRHAARAGGRRRRRGAGCIGRSAISP